MRLWHEIIKLNHSYVTFGLWRGGRGLVDICQGCCMPCLHRSWYPPLFKMIPPFKFNTFSSTLVLKNLHHRGQADNTPSDGFSLSLLKDITQSTQHQQWAGGEKKRRFYCVHKMMDHTCIPLILPTAVCTVHITYQWQPTEVKRQFHFDRTALPFESLFACIRWSFEERKKTQSKTRSEYVSAELESRPSLSLPRTSFIPSHYSKWKWKLEPEAFVFEQRQGSRLWMFKM